MPVWNRKCHIGKTRAVNPCDGCGRILPRGSMVMLWSIWEDGYRKRVRLCSDCQDVVYGCGHEDRRQMEFDGDYLVRAMCEGCDSFPVCDKVKWLREEKPGEIWFGDVDGLGVHAGD